MCTETTGCSPFGSTLAPGWMVYVPPVDGNRLPTVVSRGRSSDNSWVCSYGCAATSR